MATSLPPLNSRYGPLPPRVHKNFFAEEFTFIHVIGLWQHLNVTYIVCKQDVSCKPDVHKETKE